MESRKKTFWIGALAGAIGGGFGAASGSNSLFVVICVAVGISLLAAWGISGIVK